MTTEPSLLEWKRREGKSSVYYTADVPEGRIRISRINKHGVPAFRVYWPDGGQITMDTIDAAKSAAQSRAALPKPEARI